MRRDKAWKVGAHYAGRSETVDLVTALQHEPVNKRIIKHISNPASRFGFIDSASDYRLVTGLTFQAGLGFLEDFANALRCLRTLPRRLVSIKDALNHSTLKKLFGFLISRIPGLDCLYRRNTQWSFHCSDLFRCKLRKTQDLMSTKHALANGIQEVIIPSHAFDCFGANIPDFHRVDVKDGHPRRGVSKSTCLLRGRLTLC